MVFRLVLYLNTQFACFGYMVFDALVLSRLDEKWDLVVFIVRPLVVVFLKRFYVSIANFAHVSIVTTPVFMINSTWISIQSAGLTLGLIGGMKSWLGVVVALVMDSAMLAAKCAFWGKKGWIGRATYGFNNMKNTVCTLLFYNAIPVSYTHLTLPTILLV